MPESLTIQYNYNHADLYNAEQRLKQGYTQEKALLVERLRAKRDRLAAAIESRCTVLGQANAPHHRDAASDVEFRSRHRPHLRCM